MIEMVTCPNGHRFPVNKEKHQDRDYRICPHKGCGAKVKIRHRKFLPSPNWSRIKEETEDDKRSMKELRRQRKDNQVSIYVK